jgi:hypothetical protein
MEVCGYSLVTKKLAVARKQGQIGHMFVRTFFNVFMRRIHCRDDSPMQRDIPYDISPLKNRYLFIKIMLSIFQKFMYMHNVRVMENLRTCTEPQKRLCRSATILKFSTFGNFTNKVRLGVFDVANYQTVRPIHRIVFTLF